MKKIRFYITLWLAKIIIFMMKLLKRNATQLPGTISYKLCPDILNHIGKPKMIIAVTGTNGKTTTSNMIGDFLANQNISYINNRYGSNTVNGIVTSFLKASDWRGNVSEDYAILEVDERSSYRVYEYITPNYLIVTNLFRDSSNRNAHPAYISSIIEDALPDETILISNADDLISSRLRPKSKHVYFSINPLEWEEEIRDSRVRDITSCPICDHELIPDFIRYNHIGKYHCENCGFKSVEADYAMVKADRENSIAQITHDGKKYDVQINNKNIVDLYNLTTTFTILSELGFEKEIIQEEFKNIEVVKTRFNEINVGDKSIVTLMAKGFNPIASSRSFDYIRKQNGKKSIVFLNTIYGSHAAWVYELDFNYIINDDIVSYIVMEGYNYRDFVVALLLFGAKKDKIVAVKNPEEVGENIDFDTVDGVYLLTDLNTEEFTVNVEKDLERILKERGNK